MLLNNTNRRRQSGALIRRTALAATLIMAAVTGHAATVTPVAVTAPVTDIRPARDITSLPLCSERAGDLQTIPLLAGKSKFMKLSGPVTRLTVGNPDIVHAKLISPTDLYLVGNTFGTTNMILQGKGGSCSVFDVLVQIDATPLEATLAAIMPEEKGVVVRTAGDSIVLSGVVSSAVAAQQVESLANSYVIRAARNLDAISGQSGAGTSISLNSGSNRVKAETLVVNMLSVEAPQQVMLEVKVAEVSKTLLDQLGASFSASTSGSRGTAAIASDFLSGTAGGLLGILKSKSYQIILEAEKKDGLVRILAEPNVMAVSGQEGSFLAGGKILIPVAQNNDLRGTTITLEEKEFGVGLKFTPTVLAGGRINLKVAPEVSELSRDGVGITANGAFDGTSVLPLITTRRASTTVQLFDGQSFAIGGLIKNSATANVNAFPFLGEIPVLGALFRSTDFQSEKSELVFVVTPRLVKPLPPDYQLPTDKIGEPDRNRVMLQGRVDTDPPARPTVAPAAPSAGGMELR